MGCHDGRTAILQKVIMDLNITYFSETEGETSGRSTPVEVTAPERFKKCETPLRSDHFTGFPGAGKKRETPRLQRPKQQMETMKKEELKTFQELGKKLEKMENIVADARNIHKTLRDALAAATMYYRQAADCRGAIELAFTTLERENVEQKNKEEPLQAKDKVEKRHRHVQTSSGLTVSKGTQTEGHTFCDERTNVNGKEKGKRGASTFPQVDKEYRGAKKRALSHINKNPEDEAVASSKEDKIEDETSKRNAAGEWQKIAHRKALRVKSIGGSSNMGTKEKEGREYYEAVIIKVNEERTYADALRKVRGAVNPGEVGVEIEKIRRSKAGELFIQIKKGKGEAEKLREALAEVFGSEANVRIVNRKETIEILDLDEITEGNEILEALVGSIDGAETKDFDIRTIVASHLGTRMAIITTTAQYGKSLLKLRKIKIGWVSCRIRERLEVVRCFRCQGFGHRVGDCKGPDRTNLCRACGKTGRVRVAPTLLIVLFARRQN